MTDPRGKPRAARKARKTIVGSRDSVGGGLEHAPAFLHASDAEIRDAYRSELEKVATFLNLMNERIHLEPVHSPQWLEWAARVDAVRDAVDIHGWSGARRARMFLIAAIDGAAHHEERLRRFADPLRTMEELGHRTDLTAAEYARCVAAGRELADMPTDGDAKTFVQVTGKDPVAEPVLFAAFIFRLRCPQFARGLVTKEGMAALKGAVASWPRSKGRPKKGDTRLPKWEAADALMKAAGLVGSTPDSLESDWKEWEARRNNK